MNRLPAIIATLLALYSTSAPSQEQAPVELIAGAEQIPLAGHITVLRDDEAMWTLDDVRAVPRAARFQRSDSTIFNLGYTGAAYWFRFVVEGPREASGLAHWVLELGVPLLDSLDVHVTHADGRTESFLTGDLRRPPPEQLSNRRFAIPFALEPAESATIHVRLANAGVLLFQMALWSSKGFQAETVGENFSFGIVYGFFLSLSLYHLLIYFWVRDRAYLYFVLATASLAGTSFVFTGYARQLAQAMSADEATLALISSSFPILGAVSNATFLLFADEFIQIRQHLPRAHRLIWLLIMANGLTIFVAPLSYRAGLMFSNVMSALSLVATLVVTIWLALRGVRAARVYLAVIGTGGLVFGGALLEIFNILPTRFLTDYGWPIGFCLSGTLFGIALADRIVLERRERTRFARLQQYLPQRVAELVMEGQGAGLLEPRRRNVTVVVVDLRGFTPFSESSAPEDVMAVLREFYDTMGKVVEQHGGTVEHFAGDSMLIFFNAPLEIPEPEKQAVQTALEMRAAFEPLRAKWAKLGHELGLGIGIADGYATIGAIGFSGRSQYAAIGAVTNLASRLCSSAQHGEILTTSRVLAAVESLVQSEPVGEQAIKGFHRPIQVVRLLRIKGTL